MTRPLDKAFDEWRGVPFSPTKTVGTLLSDRELAIARQAFAGGMKAMKAALLAWLADPIAQDLACVSDAEAERVGYALRAGAVPPRHALLVEVE